MAQLPITFNKGLDLQYEDSLIEIGATSVLENFVPEETGGVRPRQGWSKTPLTGGPVTSIGNSIGSYTKVSVPTTIQRVAGGGTSVGFGEGTPPTDDELTWSKPTKPGNTLIIKLAHDSNGGFQPNWSPSTAHGAWWNGYQLLWSAPGLQSSEGFWIFVKEGRNHTISDTLWGLDFNSGISAGAYQYEMIELAQVAEGSTPKNLLHSTAASPELGSTNTSIGGTYFSIDGGTSMLPTELHTAGGPAPLEGGGSWRWGGTVAISTTRNYDTQGTGMNGIPVTPNTQYTFSTYVGAISATDCLVALRFRWYTVTGTLISTATQTETQVAVADTWERRTYTQSSPSNAAYVSVGVQLHNTSGVSNRKFYLDNNQLELGNVATTWVPGSLCPETLAWINGTPNTDSSNPISLVGNPTTASITWSEATCWMPDRGGGDVAFSGWTNSYTAATENYQSSNFNINFASAYKVCTTVGTPTSTDVTESTPNTTYWILLSIPFAYSAIIPEKWYMSTQDDSSSFKVYYIDKGSLDSGSWNLLDTQSLTVGGIPVAYSSGLGYLMWSHPSMASPRSWQGVGSNVTDISAVAAGTTLSFYKTRFFLAGVNLLTTRLFYSEIADPTNWPALNFLDIGKDDGFPISDLASLENSLIIVKGNSIYSLSGSGPDTFFLSKLPYGDAAPGRSICVTPSGAVVAGLTNVWSVVGSSIENLSKKLGAEYGPTGYVFTAYADDKVHILDVDAQKIYVYDITQQSWWIETLDSVANQPVALYAEGGKTLLAAPKSTTDTGLLMHKSLPPADRHRDFGPITAQTKLTSGLIWPVGPTHKFTPRWLYLQIRQRGDGPEWLDLTIEYDEATTVTKKIGPFAAGRTVKRFREDLGRKRGISSIRLTFEDQEVGNLFDVEQCILDYDEEEIA